MDPYAVALEHVAVLPEPAVIAPEAVSRSPRSAPELRLSIAIQLFLALGCAAAEIYSRLILHLTGPYSYPLRTKAQTCWDFILFTNKFRHFGTPSFFQTDPGIPFSYPAPVAVAYAIFFRYHAHPLAFFLSFIVGAFLFAGILLGLALRRRGVPSVQAAAFVGATLLFSYPLWFELKQANIEICVWVLVASGVWAFFKGRGYTAAACFGIAGSMKIFPFVYLALFLTRRRYREIAFSAVTAAASTLLSLWIVGPSIPAAWRQIEDGIASFRTTYILHLRVEEIGFDHSLFGIYKRFAHPLPPPDALSHILNIYVAVAAVAGVALYFLVIRRLPILNQVLCLTVATILLPPISFDYTLLHLYIPWAMLVLVAQQGFTQQSQTRSIPGLAAAFLCLAILMAPESEFIHHATHFGGQIKALTLGALMLIGVIYPFRLQILAETPLEEAGNVDQANPQDRVVLAA